MSEIKLEVGKTYRSRAGKRWNPETMQVEEIPEKEQIEKFLKGYANGVKWSHEQLRKLIENYLKHREDKK